MIIKISPLTSKTHEMPQTNLNHMSFNVLHRLNLNLKLKLNQNLNYYVIDIPLEIKIHMVIRFNP